MLEFDVVMKRNYKREKGGDFNVAIKTIAEQSKAAGTKFCKWFWKVKKIENT